MSYGPLKYVYKWSKMSFSGITLKILTFEYFVIKVPTLVQLIVTIYRVQAYQVPIVNPRWPPKIQYGRHEI